MDLNNYISKFPKYIQKYIFTYVSLQTNSGKLIQNIIDTYDKDHCWHHTKRAKLYFIKNILPFYYYVFDSMAEPHEYQYGSHHYDNDNYYKIENDY